MSGDTEGIRKIELELEAKQIKVVQLSVKPLFTAVMLKQFEMRF